MAAFARSAPTDVEDTWPVVSLPGKTFKEAVLCA
jgi:hypothetical protein